MNDISFQGGNLNIRQANKILHRINAGFPAVCPWKISRLGGRDGSLIYCPVSQEKLNILRNSTFPDNISDYKYAAKILEGVKQFKVANCKEFSELSYLIASANNIKNCYCANVYGKISDGVTELKDFGHSVLLIMPKPINNHRFEDKYYVNKVSIFDSIVPDDKTIVVDASMGIVDYWKNAIIKYAQTPLKSIASWDEVRVCLRQPLLSNNKDLNKIKKKYPILNFDCESNKIKRRYHFYKGMRALNIFKKENNVITPGYSENNNLSIWNAIKSYFNV